MNEHAIAFERWSRILPVGYIGQQSFFTTREILSRISLHTEFSSCLDLGCGRGQFALFLGQRMKNLSVTGIDIDDGNLDVARGFARENGLGDRIVFRKGDFNDKKLLSGAQWDGIISIDALQHAIDLKESLFRVRDAWTRRGPFIVSLWTFEHRSELRELASLWEFECIYPMKVVRAIISNLGLGLLVQKSGSTFANRIERSLSSLVQYEVEFRRLFGTTAYKARLALEQATCAAVASGGLSQAVIYAPSKEYSG